MILNNPFFKKLLDDKEPYYSELRNIAVPLPDTFYNNCKEVIKQLADISEETRGLLNEYVLWVVDLYSTLLLPFIGLTTRIFIERPEAFLEGNSNKTLQDVAFTYSDLFDFLKQFPFKSAEKLILKISPNSSITSKLISSFRNDDKDTFCATLYDTKEDYSNYLLQIYDLSLFYDIVNSGYQTIKTAIESDKDIVPENNVNPLSFALSAARSVAETPLSEEEEALLVHRLEVYKSCAELLDDADTFIGGIINKVKEDGLDDFYDSILFVNIAFTCISCLLYSKLKDGMTIEERAIYENLFKQQSADKMDYLNDMIHRVTDELSQENENMDGEIDETDAQIFLPENFFNRECRTTRNDSVGIIDDKYREKGVSAYCALINFLADEKYIDDDIETKRNFAFKLSGYYRKYDKGIIHWYGDTNILSVLIQKLCNSYDKWDRAKKMFTLDTTLYNSSSLRKKRPADMDFAKLFYELYGIDLYK